MSIVLPVLFFAYLAGQSEYLKKNADCATIFIASRLLLVME